MFWSAAETNVHNLSFCLFKVFYLVGLQEGGSSESEESWEVRSRWSSERSVHPLNSWWTWDGHDSILEDEDTSSPETHREMIVVIRLSWMNSNILNLHEQTSKPLRNHPLTQTYINGCIQILLNEMQDLKNYIVVDGADIIHHLVSVPSHWQQTVGLGPYQASVSNHGNRAAW